MTSASDPHDDQSPWTQRGFIIAAVIVAAIALGAVILAIAGGDGGDDAPPSAQGTAPTTALAAPATGGSTCGLPAGDQDVPTGAPPGTNWELVGSMAAPRDPERIGPGRTTDGIGTCFAHSPLGALYAAVNFWASSTARDPADVYATLAADTPARAAAIRGARQNKTRLDERGPLQVAGFRYLSYDDRAASIDLAFRLTDGRFVRLPSAMRWEGGDWKLVIAGDGKSGGSPLSDLSGYTEWSGA